MGHASRVGALESRQLVAGDGAAADAAHGEEVRVVERVQHFRRELEVDAAVDGRALREAEVVLLETGAGDDEFGTNLA